MESKIASLRDTISVLQSKADIQVSPMENGISLLSMRLDSLLSYSTNLVLYSIMKINGIPPTDDLRRNLIRQRLILEKSKPLEQKLKYQIDKLVQAKGQEEGGILSFKPKPELLNVAKVEQAVASSKDNLIYKPPKIAPRSFDVDHKKEKRREKDLQRASQSRIYKDLVSQYDEQPEELDAEGVGYGSKGNAASKEDVMIKEREDYEEENFMRLNLTRADKKAQKRMQKQGGLIRFRNEFDDLHKDFKEFKKFKIDDAKVTKSQQLLDSKSKKYEDAADLITKVGKQRRADKGKDKFTSQKKILKKFNK